MDHQVLTQDWKYPGEVPGTVEITNGKTVPQRRGEAGCQIGEDEWFVKGVPVGRTRANTEVPNCCLPPPNPNFLSADVIPFFPDGDYLTSVPMAFVPGMCRVMHLLLPGSGVGPVGEDGWNILISHQIDEITTRYVVVWRLATTTESVALRMYSPDYLSSDFAPTMNWTNVAIGLTNYQIATSAGTVEDIDTPVVSNSISNSSLTVAALAYLPDPLGISYPTALNPMQSGGLASARYLLAYQPMQYIGDTDSFNLVPEDPCNMTVACYLIA